VESESNSLSLSQSSVFNFETLREEVNQKIFLEIKMTQVTILNNLAICVVISDATFS